MSELSDLFKELRIEKYLATFEENEIEYADLFDLGDDDLVELIPAIGPRNRLKRRVEKLPKKANRNKVEGQVERKSTEKPPAVVVSPDRKPRPSSPKNKVHKPLRKPPRAVPPPPGPPYEKKKGRVSPKPTEASQKIDFPPSQNNDISLITRNSIPPPPEENDIPPPPSKKNASTATPEGDPPGASGHQKKSKQDSYAAPGENLDINKRPVEDEDAEGVGEDIVGGISINIGVIHSGDLQKIAGMTYKSRFFQLLNGRLRYFEDRTCHKLLGQLELTKVTQIEIDQNKKKFGFTISTGDRQYILASLNAFDRDEWVKQLCQHICESQGRGRCIGFHAASMNQGWLTKLGQIRKTWKRRYCCLTKKSILYFNNDKECHKFINMHFFNSGDYQSAYDRIVLGEISLECCQIHEHLEHDQHEHVFQIVTPSRTTYLSASNKEDMEAWVWSIRNNASFWNLMSDAWSVDNSGKEQLQDSQSSKKKELTDENVKLHNQEPNEAAPVIRKRIKPIIRVKTDTSDGSDNTAEPGEADIELKTDEQQQTHQRHLSRASISARIEAKGVFTQNRPDTLYSGNLLKIAGMTYKKRYFQLEQTKMIYFEDHTKQKLLGSVQLKDITYVEFDHGKKRFGFTLHTETRKYDLASTDGYEREKWSRFLCESMKLHNRCCLGIHMKMYQAQLLHQEARGWKKRFCVITPASVLIFGSERDAFRFVNMHFFTQSSYYKAFDQFVVEEVKLEGCRVVEQAVYDGHEYCFQIFNGGQTNFFSASREEEQSTWVWSIRNNSSAIGASNDDRLTDNPSYELTPEIEPGETSQVSRETPRGPPGESATPRSSPGAVDHKQSEDTPTPRSAPRNQPEGTRFQSIPLASWTPDDVADWVVSLGSKHAEYAEIFRENGIDGDFLRNAVTEEQVKMLVDKKLQAGVLWRKIQVMRKN